MEIELLARSEPVDGFVPSFPGNVFDGEAVSACLSSPAVYVISSDDEEAEVKAAAAASVSVKASKPVGKGGFERRVSARLQSQLKKDRPEADCGKRKTRSSCGENDGRRKSAVERKQESVILEQEQESVILERNEGGEDDHFVEEGLEDGNAGEGEGDVDERRAYARVKRTLRIFNSYYLHFTQEEEKRCKREEYASKSKMYKKKESSVKVQGGGDKNAKASKFKTEDIRRPSKRPDLKAITEMIATKAILYPKGTMGQLPGWWIFVVSNIDFLTQNG